MAPSDHGFQVRVCVCMHDIPSLQGLYSFSCISRGSVDVEYVRKSPQQLELSKKPPPIRIAVYDIETVWIIVLPFMIMSGSCATQ